MPGKKHQRSSLRSSQWVEPQLGARHPIVWNKRAAYFIGDAETAIRQQLPPRKVVANGEEHILPRFRMYDDEDRSGVTVLERRLLRAQSQRQRIHWTRRDIGRIIGEIQNEVDKLEVRRGLLEVTFVDVVRFGDASRAHHARKLGLIIDQASPVSELMVREHEIALNGLSGSMQRFKYPQDDYVPHWTIAQVYRRQLVPGEDEVSHCLDPQEVDEMALGKAITAVRHLLPITLQLGPLQFYSQQQETS